MEGVRLIDADPGLIDADSNVHPVVPSMSNLNLNAHVPLDVQCVTDVLARSEIETAALGLYHPHFRQRSERIDSVSKIGG